MCERQLTKRLGCCRRGHLKAKKHRFFWGLGWKALLERSLPAPYEPRCDDRDPLFFYRDADKAPPALPSKRDHWKATHFASWG